ncbi:MAG: glycosyltransferase family 4 protein [Candidatus Woesearchaeota archaeon]
MLHYSSQYANALSGRFDTYVVIPSYSDTTLFDSKVNLIKILAPPSIPGTVHSCLKFWSHLKLINQIKELNPGIVQCMDDHPFYLFYLSQLRRFNLYVTLHDVKFHSGEEKGLISKIDYKLHNYYFKHAKKLIVHGETQKEDLKKYGVEENKIVVVAHGDYSFFTNFSNPTIKTEEHTILFFGRIVQYKGVDTLIKSVPYIIKTIPHLRVIIAGEGDFSQYKRLISSETKSHFEIFNKYLSEKEIAELFQRCSFVVLPYDDATQSGIIPIAYAFKKPVITTRVGSLSEVVDEGETGLIIPPKDPEKLAEAVIELFNQNLKIMGKKSYDKMGKMMNWKDIVNKIFGEK